MTRGSRIAIAIIIIIGIGTAFAVTYPFLGTTLYNDTGGAIGTPPAKPAPPPPISVDVGQMMWVANTSYANDAEFPVFGNVLGGIVIYPNEPSLVPLRYLTPLTFGPHTLYAFNITNRMNVSITQVVVSTVFVNKVGGTANWTYPAPYYGLVLPFGTPWYFNGTYGNESLGSGVFGVNYEIANVTILPHSSLVLLNSTDLSDGYFINFHLSNGTWIRQTIDGVPNFPP
ncbi:MAG: hypothetical protein JRN26_01815 [Nitrososphaerota archaeon]|nr:hypothetical protein [Nitrososphaerota archaeon]MDG6935614.1 hypothetical protein [Nitrososphaerota archaeon]MDG6944891.1 hypothetical protein [Nitrososphaerota archaeon]